MAGEAKVRIGKENFPHLLSLTFQKKMTRKVMYQEDTGILKEGLCQNMEKFGVAIFQEGQILPC